MGVRTVTEARQVNRGPSATANSTARPSAPQADPANRTGTNPNNTKKLNRARKDRNINRTRSKIELETEPAEKKKKRRRRRRRRRRRKKKKTTKTTTKKKLLRHVVLDACTASVVVVCRQDACQACLPGCLYA